MPDRAKREGEVAGVDAEVAEASRAPNDSLLSQGMHAIANLFGGDEKKPAAAAETQDPAAALALLEEMKPQVHPFGDLDNPAFVMFFHRFMTAWYAASEMV